MIIYQSLESSSPSDKSKWIWDTRCCIYFKPREREKQHDKNIQEGVQFSSLRVKQA